MTFGEEVAVLIQGFDESDITFALSNNSNAELRNVTENSTVVLLYPSADMTEQIRFELFLESNFRDQVQRLNIPASKG